MEGGGGRSGEEWRDLKGGAWPGRTIPVSMGPERLVPRRWPTKKPVTTKLELDRSVKAGS
jgi:hypothetical protein